MELTGLTALASIALGLAGVCIFGCAYFHNLEDAKYQVIWSDLVDHR